MKISITRALSELKVLQKRFDKELAELKAISVQHGMVLRGNVSIKPEDFKAKAKSMLESIEALERRILMIKTEIQQSNSVTLVKIGSKEMTVLEAIIQKSLIYNRKNILRSLKRQLEEANDQFEKAQSLNDSKVEKQLEDYSSKSSGSKIDSSLEKEIRQSVEKLYPVLLIDPCNLSEKIKELEQEIEDFENNVDFALSESNALTLIEVGD